MDREKYFKSWENVFKIVDSDNKEYKYNVEIYDKKNCIWKNADIYSDSIEECKEITLFVFNGLTDDDRDVNITIDYGADPDEPDEEE